MWCMAKHNVSTQYRDLLNEVGYNIQRRMIAQGLSWRATGEALGVSCNTIGRWIHAKSECGLENLLKLCKLFGCNLRDLVPNAP